MRSICTHWITRCVCGLTMVLGLLLLAACSSSNTALQAPSQQCGAVHTQHASLATMDRTMAPGAEDCFWQSFQQCRPATLTFTQSDSVSGTVHTFSLSDENGTCKVTDSAYHFVAPYPPQSAITYTCAGVQKQANGLHILSCGTFGTILIPAVGVPT